MKGAIYAVLGLIAAAIGIWFGYAYATQKSITDNMNLIIAVPFIILALVFVGLFLAGRVNQEEEIHITK